MRRLTCILFIFLTSGLAIMAQEPEMFRIEKAGISSRLYNDMAPVLTPDGIAFCSDRKSSAVTDVRTWDRQLLYNIYYAFRKDTLEWGKATMFTSDLSPLANEGPFCFSPDGNQIYYTSNIKQGKEATKSGIKNNIGIFIADRQGDRWTNIRPFVHNDPLWNVGHPFISSDGKYLFFASDIPGGSGGADIWYSEWVNGAWSRPVNPGKSVNTPDSELYPWFSPAGELYFASDRAGGKGGLDLYSSSLRNGSWKQSVALPEPINSRADDFSYIMDNNGADGFFASNRDRNDDIYYFQSLIIRKNNCDSLVIDQFCYEFIEDNAQKFDSMPFDYEWDFGDGTKARGMTAEHCFSEPGTYLVKLNAIDLITNLIQFNEVTYLLEIKRTEQAYIDSEDKVKAGEAVIFDASATYLPGWDIVRYYWNFDDGSIAEGVTYDKVFTVPGVYHVQLIVTAAPDEQGVVREACVSKVITVE